MTRATISAYFTQARKAVGAGLVAGLFSLLASLDGGITRAEVGVALGAFLTAVLAVYGIKNATGPETGNQT